MFGRSHFTGDGNEEFGPGQEELRWSHSMDVITAVCGSWVCWIVRGQDSPHCHPSWLSRSTCVLFSAVTMTTWVLMGIYMHGCLQTTYELKSRLNAEICVCVCAHMCAYEVHTHARTPTHLSVCLSIYQYVCTYVKILIMNSIPVVLASRQRNWLFHNTSYNLHSM